MILRVLLDTNALLGLVGYQRFGPTGVETVRSAGPGGALVSPITAWEIACACRFRRNPKVEPIRGDPAAWFKRRMAEPPYSLVPFTPEIAFEAYAMPEPFQRDPGDRFLVATARLLQVAILTNDAKILAYAARGHVQAIAY